MPRTREISALGAYWKYLRRHYQLTQDDLVLRLGAFGLSINVKQVWGWEKGTYRPSSLSKARVDQVLGSPPATSDRLLVYDEEQTQRFGALQQIIDDETQPEMLRQQAEEKLQSLEQAAVAYGVETAQRWLHERVITGQDGIITTPLNKLAAEAVTTLDVLYTNMPGRAAEWLRYGRFLAAEISSGNREAEE